MMAHRTPLDTEAAFGSRPLGTLAKLAWVLSDWKKWGPSRRRKLRKRFAHRFPGPFDITHQELALRLYPAENHCDRVIISRGTLPEAEEHDAIRPYIPQNAVFVDIGANVGTYTIFAGRLAGANPTLVAFEPHPRTFEKLIYNMKANGLSTDHVLNCGVAGEDGVVELWSDGGSNIGHTSMLKAGTSNPKHAVRVPVRPLLSVLEEKAIDRIDLLKIDIEGFEDRALAPFLRAAPQNLRPTAILMEMEHRHLWETDLVEMLLDMGYRETKITPLNTLFTTGDNRDQG